MAEGSSDGSELGFKEGTEDGFDDIEGTLLGAELQVSQTFTQTYLAGGRLSVLNSSDAQVFAILLIFLLANHSQSLMLKVPSFLLCQYLSDASWVPQYDGNNDGVVDGFKLSSNDGFKLGFKLGSNDGFKLGSNDGFKLGSNDGFKLGSLDGSEEGKVLGVRLG